MDLKRVSTNKCGEVISCSVTSPIGTIGIYACTIGVHFVRQEDNRSNGHLPNTSGGVNVIHSETNSFMQETSKQKMHIQNCIAWLNDYFGNSCGRVTVAFPQLCLPITKSKVSFRQKVWMTLAKKVDVGETISYADLAKVAGYPHAARAVGSAMKHNPFQFLIPCHRVIRKDASVGHYCGGKQDAAKKWLLNHESGVSHLD